MWRGRGRHAFAAIAATANDGASAEGIAASGGRCVARSGRSGSRRAGGAARRGRSGSGGLPRVLLADSGPSSQGRSAAAASGPRRPVSARGRAQRHSWRRRRSATDRDDRLKLSVEDHLVGEPVLADPIPARYPHQQRLAEPSEGGSRHGGEHWSRRKAPACASACAATACANPDLQGTGPPP